MTLLHKGLLTAGLQCVLVLSLAARFQWDRARLPRAWARVYPADPGTPVRGRYISLRLEIPIEGANSGQYGVRVRLFVRGGHLRAAPDPNGIFVTPTSEGFAIGRPLAFFISDRVADPSRRTPGEELWAEVTVPRKGPPRPIRLAVKKNGVLEPLELP